MSGAMRGVRAGAVAVLAAALVCAGRWTAPSVPVTPVPSPAKPAVAVDAAEPVLKASWRLLFVRGDDIWIAAGDGSVQRRLVADGQSPCWSPDRKRFAFVRAAQVWVADAEGRDLRQLTDMLCDDGGCTGTVDLAWDPVDEAICYSRPGRLRVAVPLGAVPPPEEVEARERDLAATAIYSVPVTAEREAHPQVCFSMLDDTPAFPEYSHPAFAADGRWLAYCCNGDIWCARRSRPPVPASYSDPPRWDYWDWWSHRLAAVADYEAANRGDEWVLLAGHLSWSPDGRHLAYDKRRVGGSGYQEVHVLEVRPDGEDRLVAVVDSVRAAWGADPSFSPDGKWVAYSGSGAASVDEAADGGPRGIVVTPAAGGSRKLIVAGGAQPAW